MGKKIIRSLLIAVLITGISVILIGCTMVLPTLDASKLNIEYNTTEIFDRNGGKIMEYQAVPGEPAKLNEIPKYVQDAMVAVEDSRFYSHNGIDFKAIGRAVYRDIITRSAAEGGSTLTQQLAKNVYLTHDKTLKRKVSEIALAAQIERNFSKEEILELYFNHIYFGNGATGIKAAAETYFDKGDHMQDLTLAESALLAGLPNAPSAYNPWVEQNRELAMQRRNIVLRAMESQGYITAEQSQAAQNEPIKLQSGDDIKGLDQGGKYPYYLDYILEEAEKNMDVPPETILRGGVKVYTHLDPAYQEALEAVYNDPRNFPPNAKDGTIPQAASVVLEAETGGIVALIGGRDNGQEHMQQGFNRASMAKVRPGSTFKPVVVYAPAIDTGAYTSTTMLPNQLKQFPGGYQPRNWNGKYSDKVSMPQAIYQSLNVPAAEVLFDIGIGTGYQYATKNFGIPLPSEDKGKLGIALGDVEISPLELAGAYTAFANNGVRTVPHAIKEIQNSKGQVIGSQGVETTQAIKPETAKVMTKLLKTSVEHPDGTAGPARIGGRDVAGKTGTTEIEGIKNGNRDAWFAGYTGEKMVMVTWMGFDQSDTSHYLTKGSEVPAAMFSKVMAKGLANTKAVRFDTNVSEKPTKEKEEDEEAEKAIIKDLAATLEGNKAKVTWSPVDIEGVKYFLYRAELSADGSASGSVAIGDFSKPGYTDSKLEAGKTYLYWVVVWKDKELAKSNIPRLTVPGGNTKPTDPNKPGTTDPAKPGDGTGTKPTDPNKPGDGTGTTPPTTDPNKPGDGTKPTIPPIPDPTTPTQPGTGTGDGGGGSTTPPNQNGN